MIIMYNFQYMERIMFTNFYVANVCFDVVTDSTVVEY